MGWNTIRRDKADTYFSRYLRLKIGQCEFCAKKGTGSEGITGLQASHFHSRRKESVRFDEQNVDVLCIGCHRKLGTDDKPAYKEWKLRQIGKRDFNLLEIRANTPAKKDRKLFELYYKEQLKKL